MRRCLLIAILVLSVRPAVAAAPRSARGTFHPQACPGKLAGEKRVTCGVLVVPENRHAAHSRDIRLPVAVYHSSAAHPPADAVLFLPGGPGGSALAHPWPVEQNPFLAHRDFVLMEPRGARMAHPALECPRINALEGRMAAGHLKPAAAERALVYAAATCRKRLASKGIDLDGYTSAETAQDVEDLRKALGYAKWDLFGLSYGTRLALTVLRDHPQGVRSVLLDSVLPPQVNFDESATANLWRALDTVFDGCATDPDCSRAYPRLKQDFARLVARADHAPLRMPNVLGPDGKPVTVRGAEVVAALYTALHEPPEIGRIPAVIEQAVAGNTHALAGLVRQGQGDSSFAWGLRLSIWCGEEAPFEDRAVVEDQVSRSHGLGGVDERTIPPAVCHAWNVAAAPARENQPVSADVPVLALAGAYDPDTPPAWARSLLATLPHARVIEFPGKSHGAGFNGCGARIATAFFDAPRGPLPLDCVLRMPDADYSPVPEAPAK